MKWYKYICLVILATVLVIACKKEDEDPIPVPPSFETSAQSMTVSYTYVEIHWAIETNVTIKEMVAEYATDSTFENFKQAEMPVTVYKNPEDGLTYCFGAITGLNENTQYYARFRVFNSTGSTVLNTFAFKTKACTVPQVKMDSVTDRTYTSAKLHATLVDYGMDEAPQEIGFCYAKHKNVSVNDSTVTVYSSSYFITELTGLENDSTYYVRAYAKNSKGIGYSEELSFQTIQYGLPIVSTGDITTPTPDEAYVGCFVKDDGGVEVTECGICYSMKENPSLEDGTKVVGGSGEGYFSCHLTGLEEGKTYHVRAYATNSKGTSYGEDKSFTTAAYQAPTVMTESASSSDYTSAVCVGNVTSSGGLEITERGMCYATTQNPTIYNSKQADYTAGVGQYNIYLMELAPGTTYYVRAYAINSRGIGYGEELSFKTKAYGQPTFSNLEVSSIDYTYAHVCAEISSDGGSQITERGFVYSTWQQNPRPDGEQNITITDESAATGSYCAIMNNLSIGLKYYVCAYATNSAGTTYSTPTSFNTKTSNVPVVTTKPVTNINPTYVVTGGNVINQGDAEVTERGVCYSTSPNPTNNDNVVIDGTGLGSFTVTLDNLTHNTTYYARAYAVNSIGVGYGEEVTFSTIDYSNYSYITYTASLKLTETTDLNASGLHTNSFDMPIISHEFANGQGTIKFGGDLTRVGASAFKGCQALYGVDLPYTVTTIGDYAFADCSDLTSIGLSAATATIGKYAFQNCTSMTYLNLPESTSLTVISEGICKGCSSLEGVNFPSNTRSIGKEAFYGCALTYPITIPSKVNTVSSKAFYTTDAPSWVECQATNPPTCAMDAFNHATNVPLYVPDASVSKYQVANGWSDFDVKAKSQL